MVQETGRGGDPRLDRRERALRLVLSALLTTAVLVALPLVWYQWTSAAARERREAVAYADVDLQVDVAALGDHAYWVLPRLKLHDTSKREAQPLAIEWWIEDPPPHAQATAEPPAKGTTPTEAPWGRAPRHADVVDVRSAAEVASRNPTEWKAFLSQNGWQPFTFAAVQPGQGSEESKAFLVRSDERAVRVYVSVIFKTRRDGEECILDPAQFGAREEGAHHQEPRVCLAEAGHRSCRPEPDNKCWFEHAERLVSLP